MRFCAGILVAATILLPVELFPATPVRAAYYLESGLCERREDGSLAGAMIDWYVQLAKVNDWSITPVYCTYDEALARLARNEIDIVGGVTATSERRNQFSFPAYATGEYRPHLFVHPSSPYVIGQPQTWQDIEIGIGPGGQTQAILEKYLTFRGIRYRLRRYASAEAAERAFFTGEIGAVYALGAEKFLSSRDLVSFPSQPTYICVPSARKDLLEQVENGILRLQSELPDLNSRIQARHFPVTPRIEMDLTNEERIWLEKHRVTGQPIIVDLTPGKMPFKGWNEDEDRAIGLVCNILDQVGKRTGLAFQYVKPGDEQMARTRFLMHEVDFWAPLGVPVSDLPGYSGGICLASVPRIFITRHRHAIPVVSEARFGVPTYDIHLQNEYRRAGAVHLKPYQSLEEALNGVLRGNVDAIAASLPEALMACQNMNIINQVDFKRVDSRILYPQRVMLVPSAGLDATLVSIVAKCVETLSEGEMTAHVYHAVTESMSHPFLTDRQWVFVVAGFSLLVLVSFTGMFLFFHIRLARALVRAQAGERARTRFLATVSHEIRTPLNAVIGFADFLTQPNLELPKVKAYANGIFRSSNVLLDLINDVLDLSKVEAGKVDMRQGVVDFFALKREFLAIFAEKVRERKIRFIFNVPAGFPRLKLSPLQFRQILLNLLGNAVKFTANGTVECSVRLNYFMDGGFDLEIVVSDTGIGIESVQLDRIFDPFEQDIATRGGRIYEGTGLGLPIVKRLVESAGGSISVKSTPHVGSTFTLRIPNVEMVSASEVVPQVVQEPIVSTFPKTVLLVDDVPLNLTILKVHLTHLGVETIRTASSGKEALVLFSEMPAELVLTDLWMPEMDGATLARQLRALPSFGGCRVVAVTADVGSGSSFDMSVFDAVLTKPITKEKLRTVL